MASRPNGAHVSVVNRFSVILVRERLQHNYYYYLFYCVDRWRGVQSLQAIRVLAVSERDGTTVSAGGEVLTSLDTVPEMSR